MVLKSWLVFRPVGEHTNRPDYALFPDQKAKNKANKKLKDNDYTCRRAVGYCLYGRHPKKGE